MPETVIGTYLVRTDTEDDFVGLLRRHWPTLSALGLVTSTPAVVYRGEDEAGAPYYVEIFEWADAEAVRQAHEHPEVMAIWEPMEPLREPRGGRPAMDFPHVRAVTLA
jgi:hypothetical protein